MRRSVHLAIGVMLLLLGGAVGTEAQPFVAWMHLVGSPTNGYVEIPHHSSLNPASAFTIEAWVSISNAGGCRSIAGKNWEESWWIGQCSVSGQPTLRSYLHGSDSQRNGGIIPLNVWTHVAVTYDGVRRRHYINGELAAEFNETGALPGSTDPMRIGSDVRWNFSPAGNIDEVRLWSVARTLAQIRDNLNEPITTDQPGLIAVWALDGNTQDIIGARDGVVGGSGVSAQTFPVAFDCGASTATALCLNDRFAVQAFWRTNPIPGTPTDGQAQVAGCANPDSGLFWFFSANNWEVMVKALNGCGLNNRFWIFSAATTNVFYRLEVLDIRGGAQKIFFNYPGPPAPAVTDTSAFATCP